MSELDYEFVTITPAIAAEILLMNTANRPISSLNVDRYAKDMLAGRWKLNGETIKISSNGVLIDGQHRLLACIKSGSKFSTLIIRGLDQSSFDTIDTGRRRSAGDIVAIEKIPNANTVAAGSRIVIAVKKGYLSYRNTVTPSDVMEFIHANPGILRSSRSVTGTRHILAEGTACGLHFLFAERDEALADQFFEELKTGVGLSINDPVYILREKLIRYKSGKSRISAEERLALVIRAFNMRRKRHGSAKYIKGLVKGSDGEVNIPEII